LCELRPAREVIGALVAEFAVSRRAARDDIEVTRARLRAEAATEFPLAQRLAWYVDALQDVRRRAAEQDDLATLLKASVQLARVIGAEPRVRQFQLDASVTVDEARAFTRQFCALLLQKMPDREAEITAAIEMIRRAEAADDQMRRGLPSKAPGLA